MVRHGQSVTTAQLPVERQASHMIDVARALGLAAQDADATDLLLDAERIAAPLVRHDPVVRETVNSMYRRSAVGDGALGGLAERCRGLS